MRKAICTGLAICMFAGAGLHLVAGEPRKPRPNTPQDKVDVLGPLLHARAADKGEAAAMEPLKGGFKLTCTADGSTKLQRNNFELTVPGMEMAFQPVGIRIDTPKAMNLKLVCGYMSPDWTFTHGDDCDLLHWAGASRVVLYVPIRHRHYANPDDMEAYHISPYGGQTISVVEFKPGELVQYGWYGGGPGKLDKHVLFDLAPYCEGEKDLRPMVNQPMFRFEVGPKGAWTVWIERDGRDGLAGGEVDGDWDQKFTHESPGARPYTVDLGKKPTWRFSVYHPTSSSKVELKLHPQRLKTGDPAGFDDMDLTNVQRGVELKDLPEAREQK